jgi:hypothetical protein
LVADGEGDLHAFPMDARYVAEMVADWRGAARAQGKTPDVVGFYRANRDRLRFHPETRARLERLIGFVADATA